MKKIKKFFLAIILVGFVFSAGCDDVAGPNSFGNTDTTDTNGGGTSPADDFDYGSFNGYYSTAEGKTGIELRVALNSIITQNVIYYSYTECWDHIGYIYEDPNNTNNLILLYTGYSIVKTYRDGNGGNQDDRWNREHTWPQSSWPGEGKPYTDLYNLSPADRSINSARSNLSFDYSTTVYMDSTPTPTYTTETGCKITTNESFEPRDEAKGDVARIMLYMDLMYTGSGDGDPINLQLTNTTGGSVSGAGTIGKRSTLIEWHLNDLPDNWEMRRNNRTFEKQGNRNPFVDNPDWVEAIWGEGAFLDIHCYSESSDNTYSMVEYYIPV